MLFRKEIKGNGVSRGRVFIIILSIISSVMLTVQSDFVDVGFNALV